MEEDKEVEESSSVQSLLTQQKTEKPTVWQKGGPSPNPTGRPKKIKEVQKYLDTASGPLGQDFFNELIAIAFYDQAKAKDRFPRVSTAEKLRALEKLIEYQVGKPIQNIEAEVETRNITISIQAPKKDSEEEDKDIIDIVEGIN